MKRIVRVAVLLILILAFGTMAAFAEGDPSQDTLAFSPGQAAKKAAAASITVSAKSILEPQSPFRDTKGHWAERYIARAVWMGLMNGYDENRFGPDDPVTRGQFVTALYRQAGSPEPVESAPFRDISGEIEEFRKAIAWGYENGYVDGKENNRFEPRSVLRRQEAMKILYSCSGSLRGMETLFTATYERYYKDTSDLADWGKTPMYWGVYNGLIAGKDDHRLKPKETATRAQLAKILTVYAQRFGTPGEEGAE